MITTVRNKVDITFLDRVKSVIKIVYPFADYIANYIKMQGVEDYPNGLYLHLYNSRKNLNCAFYLSPDEITKMVFDKSYTPLHNEKNKKSLERFLSAIEQNDVERSSDPEKPSKVFLVGINRPNHLKLVGGSRRFAIRSVKCYS